MDKKIFKFKFKIRCYCNGIYSYADAHLSIIAENEDEAKKKMIENTTFEMVNINVENVMNPQRFVIAK